MINISRKLLAMRKVYNYDKNKRKNKTLKGHGFTFEHIGVCVCHSLLVPFYFFKK